MSVSSGSDITIPIQDSPPPPPSPYANGGAASKTNEGDGKVGVTNVSIVDPSEDGGGRRTPEPRGDVTVTVGFVNDAYQDQTPSEEKKSGKPNGKNGAISISVAGPGSSDKLDSELAGVHLNEAVNPELINMNILNTIPDKPNPEFGPYDNLDEYFVPVNQHKKFLRSEKLYVTKDKRKESRWKKYVCWLIGASVLATIVTVAVLAGIGLIPQKSPNRYTDSVVGTTPPESPSSSSSTPTDILISSSPDSSLPSSTEINTPPSVPFDALYVPMAADVAFHITDLKYEPALNDNTSERFRELAREIQDEIKDILKTKVGLTTVYSRISKFEPGSVYVKMRIGWADQSVEFQKVKFMLSNVDTVGRYRIMPISTYDVVNLCRINLNGCSHNCSFDYIAMDFYCSCDENMYYLAEDKKTCMPLFEMSSSSTSTTTSEEPLPEISSSASPEVESSSDDIIPVEDSTHLPEQSSPPHSSEETETQTTNVSEEHQHEHETHEQESEQSTQSYNPSEMEPISQHHSEEMIILTSTSTTEAPVSEEIHHEPIIPITTEATTTTSTTTTTEVPALSEASQEADLPDQHPYTTVLPEQESETVASVEEQHQQPVSEDITRTNLTEQFSSNKGEEEITQTEARSDLELIHPTETSSEEHVKPENPLSSENTTSIETNLGEMGQQVPTETLVEENADATATTLAPQLTEHLPEQSNEQQLEQHEEVVEQQPQHHEETTVEQQGTIIGHEAEQKVDTPVAPDVIEAAATTNASPVSAEEEQVGTTFQPPSEVEAQKEVRLAEDDNEHHITPMDILNFSSESSSTTPATHGGLNVLTTTATPTTTTTTTTEASVESVPRDEQEEGRSFSTEVVAQNSSDTVENPVENSSSLKSQSLTEDEQSQNEEESVTEGQNSLSSEDGAIEGNTNREARRFSSEDLGSVEHLITGDETSRANGREREELLTPVVSQSQNVTESASIETADENPGTALVTSKTSSESESREAGAQNVENNNDSSQSLADNNIYGQSASSESELSQESPISSDSETISGESISEETTTFQPKSLVHDVDINYIGNLNEDHSISEPVVEVETVSENQNGKDKEKLVVQSDDDDVLSAATTTTPLELEQASQDEGPTNSPPASSSAEVVTAIPNSHAVASSSSESSQGREETTRSITSEISEEVESEEFSNRDHRDTETDIETPSLSSSSAESSAVDVDLPTTDIPTTTTTKETLTTTSTTSTTTASPPLPLPQEILEAVSSDIITTLPTTSSTTTVSPNVGNVDSHNNKTSIHSATDSSSSLSIESPSFSASSESSNSNSYSYSQESSSLELLDHSSSSASHEEAPTPTSPSPSSEDHDNELT